MKEFLLSERAGMETFEVVLITAMIVAIIIASFKIVGPAVQRKVQEIADNMNANTGATIGGAGK